MSIQTELLHFILAYPNNILMINNGKELFNFIDSLLKPHGFVKEKETWYLFTNECVCFFSMEKSSYSGRYGHVMGCFLNEISEGIEKFPKYYKNDLKSSLFNFVGKELSIKVFDLENGVYSNNERENIITELFETYIIPFLMDISSKEKIKNALTKHEHLKFYMKGRLKIALGIPIED